MHKNKIDLTFVPWRRDGITRHYVERNGATLEVPTRMTAAQLAAASTYCTTVSCPIRISHMRSGLLPELCLTCLFLRSKSFYISAGAEKDHKIK